MKVMLLALGAAVCFAQATVQNGFLPGGPVADHAGSSQSFTAETIVETDRTLVDRSHVVHCKTVTVTRDSQGRIEEIPATPPTGSSASKAIFIRYPVPKANNFLGADHVEYKTPMLTRLDQAGATSVIMSGASTGLSLQRFTITTAHGGGDGPIRGSTQAAQAPQQLAPCDLGAHSVLVIVRFEASRIGTTLRTAAGKLGNQNPLLIVSERLYSQDLEATVLAKYSDPRLWTSSHQFTTMQQTEPRSSLFKIPDGYKVQEDGQ